MQKHEVRAGAPGRRSSAWSLGLFASATLLVFSVTSLGMAQGWGEAAHAGSGAERPAAGAFDGAAPSLDGLAAGVLRALVRGDGPTLEGLRLSEFEHNEVVWPELPASAPEINYPVDYAWTNIENRNRRAVARILEVFADRALDYQGVECRGDVESFESFRVHTDCYVIFTQHGGLERWQVQLFKDVLERSGGYKIFRYYDEEPGPYRSTGREVL